MSPLSRQRFSPSRRHHGRCAISQAFEPHAVLSAKLLKSHVCLIIVLIEFDTFPDKKSVMWIVEFELIVRMSEMSCRPTSGRGD